MADISLYFHIPFCDKKCPYCHFFVLPNKKDFKEQLLEGLRLEWAQKLTKIQDHKIVSVYFGGGTPALFLSGIREILKWIAHQISGQKQDIEITIEANPETLSKEMVLDCLDMGINRVSIGVQSLDDDILKTLGRTHSAKKAIDGVHLCHDLGLSNISIDLMYEIPNLTPDQFQHTLDQVSLLPITHLSLYNLTFEPHTTYNKQKKALLPLVPDEQTNLNMLNQACANFEKMGLNRYEISAFAKPGLESRHNLGYWQGRPFLGLGPSAFSYWDKKRFRNVANLRKYLKNAQNGDDTADFIEELDPIRSFNERLAIGLRVFTGYTLPEKVPQETQQNINQCIQEGFLEKDGRHLTLTEKGRLFYDTVASILI